MQHIYSNCEYCGQKLDEIEQVYYLGLCRKHANAQEGIMIGHSMPTYDELVRHCKYIGLEVPTIEEYRAIAGYSSDPTEAQKNAESAAKVVEKVTGRPYLKLPENATVKQYIRWLISQDNTGQQDQNVVKVEISDDWHSTSKQDTYEYNLTVEAHKITDTLIHRVKSSVAQAVGQVDNYFIEPAKDGRLILFANCSTTRVNGVNGAW